jgi:hypothetical protein
VVGAREVHYLEGERFHAEVGSISERHGQVDLPEGNSLKPAYDSMEWSTGWSYHHSQQPHGIIDLDIEEVEAAPTIHEDMR